MTYKKSVKSTYRKKSKNLKRIKKKSNYRKKSKNLNRIQKKKYRKKSKKNNRNQSGGGGIFSALSSLVSLPLKPVKMVINNALPALNAAINGKSETKILSEPKAVNSVNQINSNPISNDISNSVDVQLYNKMLDNLESIQINNANISTLKQLSQNKLVENMPDYIAHLKVIDL